LWRLEPAHGTGVAVIALDPDEARFVLERGYGLLDGERWRASLDGWHGRPDMDGRVSVRLERAKAAA
jgi:hypothetical protein